MTVAVAVRATRTLRTAKRLQVQSLKFLKLVATPKSRLRTN